MALTASNMMNLGTAAPGFCLPDVISGKELSLEELRGTKGTLIMFICNHCPYVIHVMPEIIRLAADYRSQGIGLVAISSNDVVAYPEDSPGKMKEFAGTWEMAFPYLYDETQQVARAYDAACTPDFYLFDSELKLAYRGRLDESRPRVENPKPLTGKDLRGALNALLSGQLLSEIQFPSMGCNIKWKS
ncbi:thioredoxin family protein [Leadbetterella sp. DM7]|uniref:thioredoxin family protein n=1 Tax=Leadbetterella sp. DM7 TaxID=3235085 RepID=UPI00349EC682